MQKFLYYSFLGLSIITLLSCNERTSFVINDHSVVFIDPSLVDPLNSNAPLRITISQRPEDFQGSTSLVNIGGSWPTIIPTKDTQYSGQLRDTTFSHGTEHIIIGRVSFYDKYILDSDANDPLIFKCDKRKGYVYLSGKGIVTTPNGEKVKLGQSSVVTYLTKGSYLRYILIFLMALIGAIGYYFIFYKRKA